MAESLDDFDDEDRQLRFDVRVGFKHPSVTAQEISAALGWKADRMWTVGEPRTTPTGSRLPGVQRQTYWARWRRFEGKRAFFSEVMKTLKALSRKREFIQNLVRTGGEATFAISLPGDRNIGDVLKPDQLKALGEAGFDLSIEVFPNMQ